MYKNNIKKTVFLAVPSVYGIRGLQFEDSYQPTLISFKQTVPLFLTKKILLFWQSNINVWLKIAFSDRKINLFF